MTDRPKRKAIPDAVKLRADIRGHDGSLQGVALGRSGWSAMTSEERSSVVLSAVAAGFAQSQLALMFDVSASLVSQVARTAYRKSDLCKTMPTLLYGHRKNPSRFWDFVLPEPNSGCWLYEGGDNGRGYGSFTSADGKSRKYAHRIAYEEIVGSIPDGMQLDHLCNTRCCCNPDHLEVVTGAVNTRRALLRGSKFGANAAKTHCRCGLELSGSNLSVKTRTDGRTYRVCRSCESQSQKRYRDKRSKSNG